MRDKSQITSNKQQINTKSQNTSFQKFLGFENENLKFICSWKLVFGI